jgi:V/A-type H+-transporting ATPase subunit E
MKTPDIFDLTHLTASIAADMLRDGVSIYANNDLNLRLSIRLKEEGMAVEFTDETISALLIEHLQPRFRALLQGIVK